MIITEFYKGQGLGNQLWCYVTTRLIALQKGYEFGIMNPENFKGYNFMDLDFGKQVFGGFGPEGGPPVALPRDIIHYYREHEMIHQPSGSDVRVTDINLLNILDDTKIDGCMQDAGYISQHKELIRAWLKISPDAECYDYSDDNTCVINFRGGTYKGDKCFFLPRNYWENAMRNMLAINSKFKFVVITDDITTAKKFFPKYKVFHFSIAKDYSIINNAKYLILSNSSFAWFPAWLNEKLVYCIAPKYWARHNISDGYWSLGYTINKEWFYQDINGRLIDTKTCADDLAKYMQIHKNEIVTKQDYSPTENYTLRVPSGKISPSFTRKFYMKILQIRTVLGATRRETSMLNAIIEASTYTINELIKISIILSRVLFSRKHLHYAGTSEEEKKIFDLLSRKFKTVVDVGIQTNLSYPNINHNIHYHLFEPNSEFTRILKEKLATLKNNNIILNEYGLSDNSADNCIYYDKSQSFEINPYLKQDTQSGHKYSLRTLDDYVKNSGITKIDFLKIDTEGFDYKVIMGGLNSINNNIISYIQFEYWTGVTKFVDILHNNFNLYLIMEPTLLKQINDSISSDMTQQQRQIQYNTSVIPLNDSLIRLIDEKLVPAGLGGNIIGINKNISSSILKRISFPVSVTNYGKQLNNSKILITAIKNIQQFTLSTINLSRLPMLWQTISELRIKRNWLSPAEINNYRTRIKVYDIFTFFNELELLEIRLQILDKYVDYFVIIEATKGHSGDNKPLYFKENVHKFERWKNKIIYHVVDDLPDNRDDLRSRLHKKNLDPLDKEIIINSLTSDNVRNDTSHWLREFYMKECAKKAIRNIDDNDVCYISDLDEIWNPELLIDYSKDNVYKLQQFCYIYYLNNRSDEHWTGWTGTIATKYKNIKNSCLNHLRTHRKMKWKYTFLQNGGWHFTFQGGYPGAKKKITDGNHPLWYKPEIVLPNLQNNIKDNIHHKDKYIRLWADESNLPKYLLDNKTKYRHLFK